MKKLSLIGILGKKNKTKFDVDFTIPKIEIPKMENNLLKTN